MKLGFTQFYRTTRLEVNLSPPIQASYKKLGFSYEVSFSLIILEDPCQFSFDLYEHLKLL